MRTSILVLVLAVTAAWAGLPAAALEQSTARAGRHVPGDTIRVAIEIAESSQGRIQPNACYRIDSLCKAQGWYDSIVTGADIDSADELDEYDVVVTGDIGQNDNDFKTYEGALKDWVRNGGGFVGLGWIVYGVYLQRAWQMDSIMAVSCTLDYRFLTSGQVRVTDSIHPVTQNVHDFSVQGHAEWAEAGLQSGAKALGDYALDSGEVSIAVREVGAGRSVYLGPIYFANFSGYANEPYYDDADAMLLLKQAIEWAAGEEESTGVSGPRTMPSLRAELSPAKPNPFVQTTTLRLLLSREQMVEVAVYNGAGQKIRSLVSGLRPAGVLNLTWDGTDEVGRRVRAGVYVLKVKAEGCTATQKVAVER